MADLKISQLPTLAESDIAANDELAVVDSSASQTSKATVKALLEKGLTLVDTGSIPSAALAGIPNLSVDTGNVVDGAITYEKIDANDIGRGLSVDTSAGNIGLSNSVTAGSKGGIVFNQYGLVTGTQNIPSADLPLSTTSAVGGVSVSTGLAVSGAGALSIATGGVTYDMLDSADVGRGLSIDSSAGNIGISNSVSAGSKSGISFNSQGLITGVSALIPSADLPKAGTSTSAIGGIFVASSGSGLTLDASTGELKVDTSGLSSAQIGTGAVQTSNLDSGAVTDAKVTNVSGAKLLAGTLTYDKIDANDIGRGLSVDTSAGNIGLSNSVSAGSKAGISYDQYGQITSVAALIPATDLPAATTSALGAISVSNGLSITAGGALSVSGITNAMLGTDSVQASQIQNNAVNNDKISGVSGAKVTVGTLSPNALNSANVTNGLTVSAGNLQIDNSVSGGAASFAGISYSAAGLITSVSALIPSSDLPIASLTALGAIKVGSNFSIDSSTGVLSIDTDGITQANLSDDCVGTAELAAGAVDNTALGTGLSGAKISNNTLPAAAIVSTDLDRSINLSGNKIGINNAVIASTHSGIAFNSEGLITGTSAILSTELPIAGASAVGAVSVASNSGLAVTSGGALSLATTTTGQTINGFVYNDFGQITSATSIASTDLPEATTTAIGAVKIPTSSSPLAVDAAGTLSIAASGVVAATGVTKFDVNAQGFVTNASALTGADIPAHSADLLTSGTLPIARIGTGQIDKSKFSNDSTTVFGSITQTGFPSGTFSGQLFFDSVEEDLYLYDGAAWQPITTLTKGSLKFAGTYDCSTSTVAAVTASGAAIGLTVGQQLPTPNENTDGSYVIVSVGGSPTGIPNGPTGQLTPPDYILSVSNSSGSSWVEIDLSTTTSNPTAANVSVTSGWGGSSSTVQTALAELSSGKIGVGGGNVTGVLKIENAGSLQWEGSPNTFELTLTVEDPTADRTLTLPDRTGTLITDQDSGTVTSSMVSTDLSNSNIAANAAIAFTKLAGLTAGNILVGNSSGEVASVAMTGHVAISDSGATTIQASSVADSMITGTISASKLQAGSTSNTGVLQLVDSTSSSSTTLAATGASVKSAYDLASQADTTASAAAAKSGATFTGDVIISDAKELRFGEVTSTGSNYISFKAPDSIASDISLVWPDTAPSAGQILKANASNANQLEWSSDAIDVAAANLTGTTMASNVVTSSLTTVGTLGSLTVSGTITGDVTGALTGNADTATTLATARSINGVSFNGSADITVTAAASTLTGTSLNSAITGSSLTAVGTLTSLTVSGTITGDVSGSSGSCTGNAATATAATNVTVADESSDTTCFPLFATAATGDLGAKSGSNLTFNSSSGALTATSFVGALTGNVTGNVSGSAATVTGAAQSAITSVGTLTGLTIASATGQMLTLNSTDGNDATLAWQRSGSRVGYIGYASTTNDHIYLRNEIDGGDMYFQTNDSGTTRTQMVIGAAVNLYYSDGDRKFRTNSTGALVENANGDAYLQVVAETDAAGNNAYLRLRTNNTTNGYSVIEFGDTADTNVGRIQYYHPDDKFQFITDNTTALTIDSSQNATFAGDIALADNKKAYFGTGNDLEIYHTGSDSRIVNTHAGDLKIRSQSLKLETTDGQEYIRCTADSDVKIFHDNVLKLNTHSTGIQLYGDGSDADGAKLILKHLNNNSTDVISSILFSNNAGEAARIQAETVGANNTGVIKFYTDNAGTSAVACTIGSDGTVSDSKGNLRSIPRLDKTSAYTITAADAGKTITADGDITIPNSVMAEGDAITIIADGTAAITITQGSGLTIYNAADASTGDRQLALRGMATIWFKHTSYAYISGAGLT